MSCNNKTKLDNKDLIENEPRLISAKYEIKKQKLITAGYFRIKLSNGKTTLKLRGGFDSNNIHRISRAMIMVKSFKKRYIELDMSSVETIDARAMALLIIALKKLEESSVKTKVTGLDGINRNLAEALGIQHITQIN